MLNWISDLINGLGYWGILALMLLENVVPPIPSELIMPLAGFVSSRSELTLVGVILAGTAGSILGTLPWYYLGRWVDQQQLLTWVERYGSWLAISVADIERAIGWFRARRGAWTVGLARMVPGVRTYISVPAGLSDMGLMFYLLVSFLGSLVWVAGLTLAGYWLGDRFQQVSVVLGPVSRIVVVGIVVVAATGWIRRQMSPSQDP